MAKRILIRGATGVSFCCCTCDCTNYTVDVPNAPTSNGAAAPSGTLDGLTNFNIFDAIGDFGGTVGSDVTPGSGTITYTGNSNNGLGTACSGTVTVNNNSGDVTYENYLEGEECETCWLEFTFSDDVDGCPCSVNAWVPFHPCPVGSTEVPCCVGPMLIEECPPAGTAPLPCLDCESGTDFDCVVNPELGLFYDGNSSNTHILEAVADAFSAPLTLQYTNVPCRYFYGNDLPSGGSVSVLLSVLSDRLIVEVKIRDPLGVVLAVLELGTLCASVECDANHDLFQQDFFTSDGSDFGVSNATFNPSSAITPSTC